jgi:hypothetical protein
LSGKTVNFKYTVKEDTCSPKAISINGRVVDFTLEDNKYRKGGALIPKQLFMSLLDRKENSVEILL